MLVLARRTGERICIGDGIVITLVAMDGGRAKIGIDAPPTITIDREEIRVRKDAEYLGTLRSNYAAKSRQCYRS